MPEEIFGSNVGKLCTPAIIFTTREVKCLKILQQQLVVAQIYVHQTCSWELSGLIGTQNRKMCCTNYSSRSLIQVIQSVSIYEIYSVQYESFILAR